MKNIILYVNSMKPAGGIERVISTLANELCKDYNVQIIVKDNGESFYELDTSVKIISIGSELNLNMNSRVSRVFSLFTSFISSSIKLKAILQSLEFDYIYVTTPLAFWESIFTRLCKGKIIASEHGARVNYNSVYNFLKLGYHRSAFYIVPTKDDYDYYVGKSFPAVHIPHLRPKLKYKQSNSSIKRVVNIGRYTNDKQQLELISMWANLINDNLHLNNWELYLVGTGELKEKMEKSIKQLHMSKNIILVPPQKEIEDIYLGASIFVLSSSSEGFGMVVLEALSFGLPVVSFDCPSGPKDIITNKEDGLLVDLNEFDSLSTNLVYLMENESLRKEMSNYGFSKMASWNSQNILSKFKGML